jgi:hypothetical protein
MLNLKLEINRALLKPEVASYLHKTLLPIKNPGSVLDLMKAIYKQFKPLLNTEVICGKLYLTTCDGYFLPPAVDFSLLNILECKLESSQDFTL